MSDSPELRETTAGASNALAWRSLNETVSPHYQRAACAGIDAAAAAPRRLAMHQRNDPELAIDEDLARHLVCETREHAMAAYLHIEEET